MALAYVQDRTGVARVDRDAPVPVPEPEPAPLAV